MPSSRISSRTDPATLTSWNDLFLWKAKYSPPSENGRILPYVPALMDGHSIRSPEHTVHPSVPGRFEHMFDTARTNDTDLIITCGDVVINAHQFVVCAHSGFFREMCDWDYRNRQTQRKRISFSASDNYPSAVKEMIRFFYEFHVTGKDAPLRPDITDRLERMDYSMKHLRATFGYAVKYGLDDMHQSVERHILDTFAYLRETRYRHYGTCVNEMIEATYDRQRPWLRRLRYMEESLTSGRPSWRFVKMT